MIYAIAVLLMVALDQIVKFLVRANIPLGESVTFIPHVLDLTYIQNTGAAFSSFTGQAMLLGIFSALVSVLLVIALVKRWVHHPAGQWCLVLILAGALGNMIDRLLLGYVTDMFKTLFMNFAIFNVADIFVVVGVIAFAVYCIFFWDRLEPNRTKDKEGDPKAEAKTEEDGAEASEEQS